MSQPLRLLPVEDSEDDALLLLRHVATLLKGPIRHADTLAGVLLQDCSLDHAQRIGEGGDAG
jgi:hypothetical protein